MAKITYYLDTRRGYQIKMRLNAQTKSCLIGIGVNLESAEQWSGNSDAPVVFHKRAAAMNTMLTVKMTAAQDALWQLQQMRGTKITLDELKVAVLSRIDPSRLEAERAKAEKEEQNSKGVLAHYHRVMSQYKGRTWEIYETTLRRIREYAEEQYGLSRPEDYESISRGGLPSDKAQEWLRSLRFVDITKEWLDDWRECMADTKGLNTQSIYLRTFRHVCKDAFDNDLTTSYIWKRYSIPKAEGEVHPLTEQEFRTLFCSDIEEWAIPYRRMAWFGFCTIGMNFVDIHKLEPGQIRDGYLRYVRSKTGRKYCIKIEQEAHDVIQELGGDGERVFCWANRYKRHSDYRQHLNHALKQMGVEDMHYYRLRHTWATFAARIGVSMDDIARSLGHGKKTVTDVYVEVDQSRIDAANRKVIDYALKVIKKLPANNDGQPKEVEVLSRE